VPLVDPATATDAQRELLAWGQGDRPYVPKVYATVANHPDLARVWMQFGSALLYRGTLPGRDREILILRAARNAEAPYEWGQHVGWARREGLSDDEIEAVGGPGQPALAAWESLLCRAADELAHAARLSAGTWSALAERYDTTQMLEACFVVGQYTMLAYVLNSAGVTAEEGAPGLGRAR
jgi:alkylhydroperoxidase family enzyme